MFGDEVPFMFHDSLDIDYHLIIPQITLDQEMQYIIKLLRKVQCVDVFLKLLGIVKRIQECLYLLVYTHAPRDSGDFWQMGENSEDQGERALDQTMYFVDHQVIQDNGHHIAGHGGTQQLYQPFSSEHMDVAVQLLQIMQSSRLVDLQVHLYYLRHCSDSPQVYVVVKRQYVFQEGHEKPKCFFFLETKLQQLGQDVRKALAIANIRISNHDTVEHPPHDYDAVALQFLIREDFGPVEVAVDDL